MRNVATDEQRKRVIDLMDQVTIVPEPSESRAMPNSISLPAKDAPIMLAAIAAQATHLLTGDKRHFGQWFEQRVEGVLIQLPSEFLGAR